MTGQDMLYYAVVGGLVALALFIRIRRFGKHQRLRIRTLWIIPTIFTLIAAAIFWQVPPQGFGWLWVGLGFVAGGAIGWQRGRLVEVSVDPATGALRQRSSPAALVFLGLLILLRWGLRSLVMIGDARWHLGAMLVSDIFIAFAVGVLGFYRAEIYLRARRLLAGD